MKKTYKTPKNYIVFCASGETEKKHNCAFRFTKSMIIYSEYYTACGWHLVAAHQREQ